jgi:hypothetical protein
MHPLSLPFLHGLRDEALLVLRVVAGGIIGYHGWLHIAGGLDGFGDSSPPWASRRPRWSRTWSPDWSWPEASSSRWED